MRGVLIKTLVAVVAGALVLPFVVAAVLVGARAVAGAGGTRPLLLWAVLASVWTLLGGLKGLAREGRDGREGHEPPAAAVAGGARRHAFPNTRGL